MNGENLLFFFSFSYEKKVRRRRRIFFFFFIYSGILGRSQYNNRNCRWRRDRERERGKKRALQQGMTRLEWLKHGTTVRGSLRGKRKNNNWKKALISHRFGFLCYQLARPYHQSRPTNQWIYTKFRLLLIHQNRDPCELGRKWLVTIP